MSHILKSQQQIPLQQGKGESTARGEDDKHKRKLYKHNPVLIHQLSQGQIQDHIYKCRN